MILLSNAIMMDFKMCSFALKFSINPNGDGKVRDVLTDSLITYVLFVIIGYQR